MGANSRRFEFWKWTMLAWVALALPAQAGVIVQSVDRQVETVASIDAGGVDPFDASDTDSGPTFGSWTGHAELFLNASPLLVIDHEADQTSSVTLSNGTLVAEASVALNCRRVIGEGIGGVPWSFQRFQIFQQVGHCLFIDFFFQPQRHQRLARATHLLDVDSQDRVGLFFFPRKRDTGGVLGRDHTR